MLKKEKRLEMGENQLKVIFSPGGGLWLLCCSELCQAEELVTILIKMVIMVMVVKMIDIAKVIKMTIMVLLIDCDAVVDDDFLLHDGDNDLDDDDLLFHLDRVSWEDLLVEEAGPHRDSSPLEPELKKIIFNATFLHFNIISFFQAN